MSSTVHLQLVAPAPVATISEPIAGRRGRTRAKADTGDPPSGVHDPRDRKTGPAAEVVDRLQRSALLKSLGSGDMGERQVGNMDIVTDRAVRR